MEYIKIIIIKEYECTENNEAFGNKTFLEILIENLFVFNFKLSENRSGMSLFLHIFSIKKSLGNYLVSHLHEISRTDYISATYS